MGEDQAERRQRDEERRRLSREQLGPRHRDHHREERQRDVQRHRDRLAHDLGVGRLVSQHVSGLVSRPLVLGAHGDILPCGDPRARQTGPLADRRGANHDQISRNTPSAMSQTDQAR